MQNVQKNLSRVFALALLMMVSTIAWAQQRITGTVQDGKGEPLIGVSVLEAGTTNGTTTNVDGQFTISVKQGASLDVSYMGYTSQTVQARNGMTVNLQEDNQLLERSGGRGLRHHAPQGRHLQYHHREGRRPEQRCVHRSWSDASG